MQDSTEKKIREKKKSVLQLGAVFRQDPRRLFGLRSLLENENENEHNTTCWASIDQNKNSCGEKHLRQCAAG